MIEERKSEHNPMSVHVLIVEDNVQSAKLLGEILDPEGYALAFAQNIVEAKSIINTSTIHITILDINLSSIPLDESQLSNRETAYMQEEGFELAAWMRDTHREIRIIFLTSRKALSSKVRGLDLGGDDYVTKPFDQAELKAIIRSNARRLEGRIPQIEVFRKWMFDIARKELTHSLHPTSKPIRLTLYEANVLSQLLKARGNIVTRESLSKSALGRALSPQDRAIDTTVSKLRAKIDDTLSSNDPIIETVHGRGYRINR